MKELCSKYVDYIILILITVICLYFYAGNFTSLYYDLGRELTFPQAILDGKVLYKDIFNLFGPMSYLLNAFILKIFGSSFTILYYAGCITAVTFVSGVYFLSRLVLNRKYAFLITLFSIIVGIMSTNSSNANYVFPYAYAIMYGMTAFIWAVYFLIKFQQNSKFLFLLISTFLTGFAVCNKYEFILFGAFMLVFGVIRTYKNKMLCFANIVLFFVPSIICFIYLFFQGLTINDFFEALILIRNIIFTESYQFYYRHIGAIFSFYELRLLINSFIIFIVCILFLTSSFVITQKHKIYGPFCVMLYAGCSYYLLNNFVYKNYNIYDNLLSFMVIFVFALFLFKFKNLNKEKLLLGLSVIFVSYKIFWGCFLHHYGVYYIPILLIALFAILDKHNVKKAIVTYLLVIMSMFIYYNIKELPNNSYKISDKINSNRQTALPANKLIEYINLNTLDSDKIVVYPEGMILNYLTKRKGEFFYYSIQPAYVEIFGEKNIISYFQNSKPEYFVIIPMELFTYNKGYLCDYFSDFCEFLDENYKLVYTINNVYNDKESYKIYKRK